MEHIVPIETEKLEYQKELAEISVKLGEARSDLVLLQTERENYLAFREQEALERVYAVLGASRAAVMEINLNNESLIQFKNELIRFSDELKAMRERLAEDKVKFEQSVQTAFEEIERRTMELSEVESGLKAQRESLHVEREAIAKQTESFARQRSHIESQQASLKAAMLEIRKKQHGSKTGSKSNNSRAGKKPVRAKAANKS